MTNTKSSNAYTESLKYHKNLFLGDSAIEQEIQMLMFLVHI